MSANSTLLTYQPDALGTGRAGWTITLAEADIDRMSERQFGDMTCGLRLLRAALLPDEYFAERATTRGDALMERIDAVGTLEEMGVFPELLWWLAQRGPQ